MSKTFVIFLLLEALGLGGSYSTSSNWLEKTPDTQKFQAIQKQLRGFDVTMQEVGLRYDAISKALHNENFELASYHWDKIKTSVENGIIRRPARKESSNTFLLDSFWDDFRKTLKTKNKESALKSFGEIKNICNACHRDQEVGFIVIE